MSNWNQVSNGGKGSARRVGANDELYKENWQRIFGKKKESVNNDKEEENNQSGETSESES